MAQTWNKLKFYTKLGKNLKQTLNEPKAARFGYPKPMKPANLRTNPDLTRCEPVSSRCSAENISEQSVPQRTLCVSESSCRFQWFA